MARYHRLKNIAAIHTSSAYNALVQTNESMQKVRYIYAPKKYEYGKTFFYEHKNDQIEKGFIITAKENIDIQYISFILNSLMTALKICNGDLTRTTNLTIKLLESIPIQYVDKSRMFTLGLCNRIIQVILRKMEIESENEVYQFYYNLFSEIRDGMSMELLMQPLFERFQIHIIDEWENLLFEHESNLRIPLLAKAMLEDDNKLMNQVRKMRILITNIGNLIIEETD